MIWHGLHTIFELTIFFLSWIHVTWKKYSAKKVPGELKASHLYFPSPAVLHPPCIISAKWTVNWRWRVRIRNGDPPRIKWYMEMAAADIWQGGCDIWLAGRKRRGTLAPRTPRACCEISNSAAIPSNLFLPDCILCEENVDWGTCEIF